MTPKQGQYLAFIHSYTVLHRQAPAEADLARYFRASPPSVHQMVLTLEKHGLISRIPGQARSIRVLVPPAEVPPLGAIAPAPAEEAPARPGGAAEARAEPVARIACRIVARLFAHNDAHPLDDAEFAPLIRCVAEAAGEELREAGVPLSESASASARVMEFAVERYVDLCARVARKTADAKDAETFRCLMAHGEWPQPGRGRR